MSFNKGDVVEFKGSKLGILYRVVDGNEFLANSKIHNNELKPHISIEVVGAVPVDCLEHCDPNKKGVFAIDVKLKLTNEIN